VQKFADAGGCAGESWALCRCLLIDRARGGASALL
jgi:hypothetical protein